MTDLLRTTDGGTTVLLGGYSPTSGLHHFPLAPVCPYTGAEDVEPVDLPGTGTLWTWTAVTAAPPGYEGPVPYGFGIVELDGIGLRVVGRLTEPDPSALSEGQPMHVVAEALGDLTVWAFAPEPVSDATGGGRVSGVEIAGIGLHPFGRFGDTTATDMGATALRDALADAGWSPGEARAEVGAAFCATAYGGVAAGHRVLGALALTGMPIVDVEAGCASGGAALALGAAAIRSGEHESVLVVGVEKMPKGIIRSSFFAPWQEQAGLAATPAYFALRAQRTMREHGLTKADLADLVVKNRRWGSLNPDAMFRKEVTADEVLASRLVCEPLNLFMLCSPNEGAAAVVLRRGDGGVQLAAAALRSHLPGSVLDESTPMAGIDDSVITPPSKLAADDAYEAAGVGPADLDLVECQDTDAARELLSWTELGVCAVGDQRRLLDADGAGRRPWRSTARAACCPRASPSGPPRWARWWSWSVSCGATPAIARSRAQVWASPT